MVKKIHDMNVHVELRKNVKVSILTWCFILLLDNNYLCISFYIKHFENLSKRVLGTGLMHNMWSQVLVPQYYNCPHSSFFKIKLSANKIFGKK